MRLTSQGIKARSQRKVDVQSVYRFHTRWERKMTWYLHSSWICLEWFAHFTNIVAATVKHSIMTDLFRSLSRLWAISWSSPEWQKTKTNLSPSSSTSLTFLKKFHLSKWMTEGQDSSLYTKFMLCDTTH